MLLETRAAMPCEVAAGASGTPKRQSKVLDTAAWDQFERLRRAELRQKLVNDGDSDDDERDHKQVGIFRHCVRACHLRRHH